jgi:hypothetical protein
MDQIVPLLNTNVEQMLLEYGCGSDVFNSEQIQI